MRDPGNVLAGRLEREPSGYSWCETTVYICIGASRYSFCRIYPRFPRIFSRVRRRQVKMGVSSAV